MEVYMLCALSFQGAEVLSVGDIDNTAEAYFRFRDYLDLDMNQLFMVRVEDKGILSGVFSDTNLTDVRYHQYILAGKLSLVDVVEAPVWRLL